MTPEQGRPAHLRVRVAPDGVRAGFAPMDLHTTVSELFWVGMELQAIADRLTGTSAKERLLGLVDEIDDVIRELRRTTSQTDPGAPKRR